MASVTLTISDTSTSGVSIHSSFKPAVGNPISPAQSHALDIIRETHKRWGAGQADGIDIDAVHRTRDNVVHLSGDVNALVSADGKRFTAVQL